MVYDKFQIDVRLMTMENSLSHYENLAKRLHEGTPQDHIELRWQLHQILMNAYDEFRYGILSADEIDRDYRIFKLKAHQANHPRKQGGTAIVLQETLLDALSSIKYAHSASKKALEAMGMTMEQWEQKVDSVTLAFNGLCEYPGKIEHIKVSYNLFHREKCSFSVETLAVKLPARIYNEHFSVIVSLSTLKEVLMLMKTERVEIEYLPLLDRLALKQERNINRIAAFSAL
jgi:hypothetical protein